MGPGGKVCYYEGPPHTIYESLGYAEVVQVRVRRAEPTTGANPAALSMRDSFWAKWQGLPGLPASRSENASHPASPTQQNLFHMVTPLEGRQFEALVADYFSSCCQHPAMPKYRSCIGIPGGMTGQLFPYIKRANVKNMKLVAGKGNDPDVANTVSLSGCGEENKWGRSCRRNVLAGMQISSPHTVCVCVCVRVCARPRASRQVYIYDTQQFPFHRAEQFLQFKQCPLELKNAQIREGRIPATGCPEH